MCACVGVAAGGGFLKVVSVGIPTYAGVKTGFSRDEVGIETGFHAGVGRNAIGIIFKNPPQEYASLCVCLCVH